MPFMYNLVHLQERVSQYIFLTGARPPPYLANQSIDLVLTVTEITTLHEMTELAGAETTFSQVSTIICWKSYEI